MIRSAKHLGIIWDIMGFYGCQRFKVNRNGTNPHRPALGPVNIKEAFRSLLFGALLQHPISDFAGPANPLGCHWRRHALRATSAMHFPAISKACRHFPGKIANDDPHCQIFWPEVLTCQKRILLISISLYIVFIRNAPGTRMTRACP